MRGFRFFTGSEDLPYNAVPVADVVTGYFNYRRVEFKADLEPNYRKKEIRESRKTFPECHKNNLQTLSSCTMTDHPTPRLQLFSPCVPT